MHIGDQILRLALKSISAIVKGITWIFKKPGALLKDIVDFLGFLFNYDDILHTHDSLVACFNVALDYGQGKLTTAEIDIKSWMNNLRTTIKSQLPALKAHDYTGMHAVASGGIGRPATQLSATNQRDDDDVKTGVAYHWATYQFTYGGGTTNAYLHDDGSSASRFQYPDAANK